MASGTGALPPIAQLAHVTTSLERAMEDLGRSFGIREWMQMRDSIVSIGPGRRAHIDVALAYKGDLMLEIIQPLGGDDAVYREPLAGEGPVFDGYAIRQHHVARIFESDAQFDAEMDRLRAAGVTFAIDPVPEELSGRARMNYADLRAELGYYVENLLFSDAGSEWLKTIPRS